MTTKDLLPACHDCGVAIGSPHVEGCDVARCMLCGGQASHCACCCKLHGSRDSNESPDPDHFVEYNIAVAAVGGPDTWTGQIPDAASCIDLGLYIRWDRKIRGHVPCEASNRYGHLDVTGLRKRATWDVAARKWVARSTIVKSSAKMRTIV